MQTVDDREFNHSHPRMAAALNGSQTWAWHLGMEGNLNRAAAGEASVDYTRYQRVIGVTWSGNRGGTNFWGAELAANRTGRKLVPLLCQLHDEGIPVNLIAHSLGARVVLTALNLIAQLRSEAVVDQVFLWEPAVTPNAFEGPDDFTATASFPAPGSYPDPLGHEHFPSAHKGSERFVVLYSKRDGILGPQPEHDDFDPSESAEYEPEAYEDDVRWDEDLLEEFNGVYSLRYQTPINIAALYGVSSLTQRLNRKQHPQETAASYEAQAIKHYVQDLLSEEARNADQSSEQLAGAAPLPDYEYLLPWAHALQPTDDELVRFTQRVWQILLHADILPPVRPVGMGWGSANEQPHPMTTNQTGQMADRGKLQQVDQTDQLASHSGMWFPDQRLFEQIVRGEVIRRFFQQGQPGFGQYQFGGS
jgi:hypothetical protein